MKLTAAMSSAISPAQRPSKWARAAIVAEVSAEWPSPMVWPISCVATSARLHWFQAAQPPHPLLNTTLPTAIRENVVPFTTVEPLVEQNPPIAKMPLQPVVSVTSLDGSLKIMRFDPQPPNAVGAVVPPSARIKFDVGTFVHAASAASIAARVVANPSL